MSIQSKSPSNKLIAYIPHCWKPSTNVSAPSPALTDARPCSRNEGLGRPEMSYYGASSDGFIRVFPMENYNFGLFRGMLVVNIATTFNEPQCLVPLKAVDGLLT